MKYAPTVLDSLGAREQGRAESEVYQKQAQIATAQAGVDEEAQRRKARQFMGDQAASIAQAGIGTGGTAANVIQQSALLAELDALNIRYGGQLKRAGLLTQAKAAKQQGNMMAGAKLLNGLTKAYTQGSALGA